MERYGVGELDIMGGEPFLLPWMTSFIREAVNRRIRINVSTNGSLPERVAALAGLSPSLLTVGISLEGSSAERHDRMTGAANFEKALVTLRSLISLGLEPVVKTVATKETMEDIPAIVELLRALGVRRYYLIHMDTLTPDPATRSRALSYPRFNAFYQEVRKAAEGIEINKVHASCFERESLPQGVRCAGGVKKLAIMPDGSVYPCNLFQHCREFRLGNIFTDTLTSIWNSRKLDYFRRFEHNSCRELSCSNYGNCTGGCPAHGYGPNGITEGQDIRCAMTSGR